ncbi:MAG: very short patch repair endonuclease [Terriglobales bacterium]
MNQRMTTKIELVLELAVRYAQIRDHKNPTEFRQTKLQLSSARQPGRPILSSSAKNRSQVMIPLSQMDTLTRQERSLRMSLVRGTDTKPEMAVRSTVHGLGYRYRLHVSKLPGKPDLVFPKLQKVLFVHGCFWHRHLGCSLARLPKSRLDFWVPKLTANRRRDRRNAAQLRKAGWKVCVVWECELSDTDRLEKKIKRFLDAEC